MVEQENNEIVAMVSHMRISMVTKLNMETMKKSIDWWFDSSVTIHIYNDKSQFKEYKNVFNEAKVLMGNHDTEKVHGKTTIELIFTSRKKLILTNVLDVKKNLVSVNLLCKKRIKVVLEAEKLILSKKVVFVGKVVIICSNSVLFIIIIIIIIIIIRVIVLLTWLTHLLFYDIVNTIFSPSSEFHFESRVIFVF